jgi:hypothetical protein
VKYNNGSTRTYVPPLPDTATEEDYAYAIYYQDKLADGSYITAFVNRTVV